MFVFVFPFIMTEAFNTVESLKKEKTIGTDGLPAEVLKTSPPVFKFILIDFINLPLLHGWFPKSPRDAKVHLLLKSGETIKIKNYRSGSVLLAIGEKFEKVMSERLDCFFDE